MKLGLYLSGKNVILFDTTYLSIGSIDSKNKPNLVFYYCIALIFICIYGITPIKNTEKKNYGLMITCHEVFRFTGTGRPKHKIKSEMLSGRFHKIRKTTCALIPTRYLWAG